MIQMPPNSVEVVVAVNNGNSNNLNTISNSTLLSSAINNSSFSSSSINHHHLYSGSSISSGDTSSQNFLDFSHTDLIESECELDLTMEDMMRAASNTGLEDIILDATSLNDLKFVVDLNPTITSTPTPISTTNPHHHTLTTPSVSHQHQPVTSSTTQFTIKQELRYINNEDDNCTTNSSFSCSSGNNETTVHGTNSLNTKMPATAMAYVSNKNGKSVLERRYGPIVVRPRRNPAPTLSSGRKSKYISLTADEEQKRETRRKRNRQAAEKCKQKRTEIETKLEADLVNLMAEKKSLDVELGRLTSTKQELEMLFKRHLEYSCCASNSNASQQTLAANTQTQFVSATGAYNSAYYYNSQQPRNSTVNEYGSVESYSQYGAMNTYQQPTTSPLNTNLVYSQQQPQQYDHNQTQW